VKDGREEGSEEEGVGEEREGRRRRRRKKTSGNSVNLQTERSKLVTPSKFSRSKTSGNSETSVCRSFKFSKAGHFWRKGETDLDVSFVKERFRVRSLE
jgi:hypothetical protein